MMTIIINHIAYLKATYQVDEISAMMYLSPKDMEEVQVEQRRGDFI